MNKQLYIWFNRSYLKNKGIPITDDIKLFDTFDNSKKNKFYNKSEWMVLNYKVMDFPPSEAIYKFPECLYLVIKKKIKEILFDYIEYGSNVKIVSHSFFSFLLENGMKDGYEISKIKIVNNKGEELTEKKYYALRFGKYDDEFFEFSEKTKKKGKHLFGSTFYTYPDMKLQEYCENKNIFTISPLAYRESLIFKDSLLIDILDNFYLPEIYKLDNFSYVYENQYNEDELPFNNNKYQIKT